MLGVEAGHGDVVNTEDSRTDTRAAGILLRNRVLIVHEGILIALSSVFVVPQIHLSRTDHVVEHSHIARLSVLSAFQLLYGWHGHTQRGLIVVLDRECLRQGTRSTTVVEHIIIVKFLYAKGFLVIHFCLSLSLLAVQGRTTQVVSSHHTDIASLLQAISQEELAIIIFCILCRHDHTVDQTLLHRVFICGLAFAGTCAITIASTRSNEGDYQEDSYP